MMKVSRLQHTSCEQQAKFIQERVAFVENNFAELCKVLGAYGHKIEGIREKNEDIAKAVQKYADGENVNTTLQNNLKEFAAIISEISSCRDHQMQEIEVDILPQFSDYSISCKNLKVGVKDALAARSNEVAKKRQLDHVRERSSRTRQQLISAETEFAKASAQVSQSIKKLEEASDTFENKKLEDIKHILLNYVKVELSFHAKAIELYTTAYQSLLNINVEEDLQDFQNIRGHLDGEFRNVIHTPESISRLETVKRTSFKSSLANLFSTPSALKRSPGAPHSPSRNAPNESECVHEFETEEISDDEDEEDGPRRTARLPHK